MADFTERFTEVWALLAEIQGDNTSGELNSGYVSLQNYHRAVVMICPVNLGSALDCDMEQATTTAGAGAKALDSGNKDVTVQVGDTSPSIIEIKCEELDVTNSFDCINLEVTATVASYYWAGVWGGVPRFAPVPTTQLDSVTD
jgi:hypothetical protein